MKYEFSSLFYLTLRGGEPPKPELRLERKKKKKNNNNKPNALGGGGQHICTYASQPKRKKKDMIRYPTGKYSLPSPFRKKSKTKYILPLVGVGKKRRKEKEKEATIYRKSTPRMTCICFILHAQREGFLSLLIIKCLGPFRRAGTCFKSSNQIKSPPPLSAV